MFAALALLGIPGAHGRGKEAAPAREARPLRVTVTVHEDAGVGRTGEGVTLGVPLSREANVRDVRTLRLSDEAGSDVPVQMRALSRWGAPATDERAPLRFVLVDLRATVAGHGTRRFELHTAEPKAERADGRPGAIARSEDGVIRVSTGILALAFSRAEPGPLRLVSEAPGVRGAEGPPNGLRREGERRPSADDRRAVVGRATSVELEENGALRACVLVRGELDGGFEERGGRHPLRWSMRWHLTAGSALARVQVVLENPDRPHERPFNENGETVGKRFGRLALELAATGESMAPEAGQAAAPLAVVQTASGFEARRGMHTVKTGARAGGWIVAGDTMLGMRSFAENHPKALLAGAGTLKLELFPRATGPVFFGGARAKTHDLWIHFPDTAATLEERAAIGLHPLRATIAPSWLQETRALGPLSVEDARRWPAFEETLDRIVGTDLASMKGTIFDERRAEKATGWLDYGDSFRAGTANERRFGNAEFDFGWVLLRQYLREADHDRTWLEQSEAVLRHVMDIDVLHTEDDAPWANHGVRKHDGAGFTNHSRGPDFSHFWVRGMLAFHLTTGDARAREVAVDEVGRWIADREDPERPGWLVHADELRDVGWVLIALADLSDATGDPRWLALSQRIARVMVAPGVSEDGTMRDAEFLNRRDSFMPWQQAYVADGLGRLCLALRDKGIPDARLEATLRRMLDFLAGEAWIEEPRTLYGETYPRMLASSVDRTGALDAGQGNMSQALADPMVWGWLLFGEPRHRTAALEAGRHTFPRGAKTYFDESIATPAKNAAVRTYFGEAARWMEQTSAAPPSASLSP